MTTSPPHLLKCNVLGCSDNEKFIGMAVISGVVIFFLTRYSHQLLSVIGDCFFIASIRSGPCAITITQLLHLCRSVGTVLFTALGISCAAIGLHGAFRQPDDLFTDEAEVRCCFVYSEFMYGVCTLTLQSCTRPLGPCIWISRVTKQSDLQSA